LKKKIFKVLLLAILVNTKFVFCQSDEVATGIFNGDSVTYFKHKLDVLLIPEQIANPSYFVQVNNFLNSINASIDTLYELEYIEGLATINLSDTSDALDYYTIFLNSGLFNEVTLSGYAEPINCDDCFDERYEFQWYLQNDENHDIDGNKVWPITTGDNSRVRIYIMDGGIYLDNTSGPIYHLDERFNSNFVVNSANDFTLYGSVHDNMNNGHGTFIAGLIGASRCNTEGIKGLSPDAEIVIQKVFKHNPPNGNLNNSVWMANALNSIVNWKKLNLSKQVVVNCSWVYVQGEHLGFRAALDSALRYNIILACGTGNSSDFVKYPAKYAATYNNVISVGATDRDDDIAYFSCFSENTTQKQVTLVAPGGHTPAISPDNIYSIDYNCNTCYNTKGGTSFSAPLVASTVALMWSVKNTLLPLQVKEKIIRSVNKVAGMNGQNYTVEYGYGRLNSFNSVVNSTDSITNILGSSNQTITLSDHLRIEDITTIPERCTILVPTGKVLILDKFAQLNFEQFGKIIIQDGGKMIQRKFSTVEDRGEILIQNNGCYIVEDSADFNFTGQGPGGPNDYGCVAVWGGTLYIGENSLVNMNDGGFLTVKNGGKIVIGKNSKINIGDWSWLGLEDDAELTIGENANILFEDWSWLIMGNNSAIRFGENSGLKFREWSYMNADTDDTSHIYLTGQNSQTRWNGIIFDSTRINDTIEKCIFSEAKTAITIRNSNVSSNVTRIFEDNIFNVPEGLNTKGIYSDNTHKITIEGNTFNMPTTVGSNLHVGIYLNTASTSSVPVNVDPEGAGEDPEDQMVYILNIINNTFNKGTASIVLANFTSNFLPYYIKSNNFEQPASQMNIFGIKIGGTIKNNVMTSMQTPLGIHLANSNPTLFNNIIPARDVALHLVGHCYPNLAPQISGNQTTWTGGKNQLSVSNFDAVQLQAFGNVFTDYGRNKFIAPSSGYHLYGWIDSTVEIYKSRNNCWYRPGNSMPNIYLVRPNTGQPISTITYNYVFDCNSEPDPSEYELDYMGHEIWDSIMISENDIGEQPEEDEQLFIQAMDYYTDNQYVNSIMAYKSLINTYPSSNFVKDALYNMYSCHEALDTSSNQDYINTLFGNLNVYLEQKIESDSYDTEFEDVAFDVKLMCESKLQNYNDAMNGYEFIALFHPDPNTRLIASWNYEAVQAILNSGSSGGFHEVNLEYLLEKKIVEVEKVISENPVMQKMKKSYEVQFRERKGLIEEQIKIESSNLDESDYINRKIEELDKLKTDKAKHNLLILKNLSTEELDRNKLEDMFLTSRNFRNESLTSRNSILPDQYKLSQNYPNPFNPTTTINYELPTDGIVTIKIFDLVGKEIATLVNESKKAGSYQVLFNGQNFSSGIYFYKIEVGNFVETRKMVLIK